MNQFNCRRTQRNMVTKFVVQQTVNSVSKITFAFIAAVSLLFAHPLTTKAATVSYWTLDESSGNYVDIVGSNDLENKGGTLNTVGPPSILNQDVADGRASNAGSQTALRGKGPHIPAVDLSTNAWTLEGYIRPGGTSRTFVASNNPNGGAGLGLWDLEHNWQGGSAGKLTFRVLPVSGPANLIVSSASIPTDGDFHHFAVTWDPSGGTASSGQISLFIDGASAGGGLGSGDQGASSASSLFYAGGFLLSSGSFHSALGTTGEMDELRISSGALSPAEFLNAVPEPTTISLVFISGFLLLSSKRRLGKTTA